MKKWAYLVAALYGWAFVALSPLLHALNVGGPSPKAVDYDSALLETAWSFLIIAPFVLAQFAFLRLPLALVCHQWLSPRALWGPVIAAGFSPETREIIIKGCARSNGDYQAGTELLSRFLIQGYQPKENLLPWLLQVLEREPATLPEHLQRLERAVRMSPAFGGSWASEWQKRAQARARFAALNQEFPALAREFTEKAQAMFTKHKIPDEKQRQYLQRLSSLESLQP